MALTDTKIRQSKPKSKPYKQSDGNGLYLQIQPKGAKYWRLAYRYAEKQKTLALGIYPEVTLADARKKRADAKSYLAKGIDPSNMMSKKVRKRTEVENLENSFESIAREWHEQQKGGWSKNHWERVLISLEKEAFPDIGIFPIHELTAPHVLAVIRKVEKRGALEVAARLLQRCSAVFRYAIQTGKAVHNPTSDLQGALKTKKVEHRAALARSDLPLFFEKLEKYDGSKITQLALKLVILTFVRTGELRGATWNEFDLDNAQWRVPAERMKMRAEHIVPLSDQAIQILNELKNMTGKHDLVFPSRQTWKKSMSENTMLYAMYRMGYHGIATVHGFRATASTILNESGFKPDVIERQLAHVEKNKVRAAYHRSEYLEERKQMMQWWADFIEGLQGNNNVVPIYSREK
jgi:integrase